MSFSDCSYMRRALELAKKARFNCPPNPAVGCVIVKPAASSAKALLKRPAKPMPKSWPFVMRLPAEKVWRAQRFT